MKESNCLLFKRGLPCIPTNLSLGEGEGKVIEKSIILIIQLEAYRLTQRNCSERRAPPWVDRVCNRTSVTGFLPFEPFKFDIFWNLHQPKGVPSSHFHQPKSLGWWKVRGGQIKKNAKFRWFKWPKTCYTLSITYSINPRGCPPLTAISLGQAVPRWQQSLSWSMQSSVNRRSDDTAFGAGTFSWQDPVH